MKIIAFIDPSKFGALLGVDLRSKIYFSTEDRDGDPIYLDGGNKLVYISDSVVNCKEYENNIFNLSKIILIPDDFKLNHSFVNDFKIIRHTKDLSNENKKVFSDKYFHGIIQSMEIDYIDGKKTPYKIIVDIIEEVLHNNRIINFEKFYKSIPNFNFELEESLNVLHLCLNPENLDQINNEYISKLPEKIKYILLDDQGSFAKLKEHKSDGPFGTNYIEALEDLRDALFSEY